jgi:hypothetical protein
MDNTSAFHLLVATTVSLVIVPTNGEFTRVLGLIALCPLIGSMVTAAVAAMTKTRIGVVVWEPAIVRPQLKPAFVQAALHTGRFGTPSLTTEPVMRDRELKAITIMMALSTSGMLNMPAWRTSIL